MGCLQYNAGHKGVEAHLATLTKNILEVCMAEPIIIPAGCKAIPLTKGAFAIVDEADYDWLIQWKWHISGNGYARRGEIVDGKGVLISMHRQIMNTPQGMETDHINRIKLDNRRSNLRICTRLQNGFNHGKYENASSKHRGVWWNNFYKKWESQIYVGKKRIYIGRFDSEITAALAYNDSARELYGEFAGLNDVVAPEGYIPWKRKHRIKGPKSAAYKLQTSLM